MSEANLEYCYSEEFPFLDYYPEETTMTREWVSIDGETLTEVMVETVTYSCGHSRVFETPVGLEIVPEDVTKPCDWCQRGHEGEESGPFADEEGPSEASKRYDVLMSAEREKNGGQRVSFRRAMEIADECGLVTESMRQEWLTDEQPAEESR